MKKLLTILSCVLIILNVYFTQTVISQTQNLNGLTPYKAWENYPASLSEELPEDFPKIVIDKVNNPMPGKIFMECFQVSGPSANYIMVMDETGKVIFQNKPENQGVDFKIQPNGRYSYSSRVQLADKYQVGPFTIQNMYVQHNILDTNYKIIDSVQMQNGYLADMHDFRILPNGNYLMIAYEHVPVDMSQLVSGGNPNAIVVGTVIQELDKDKKCVFQWRSLDYIPVLATKDDTKKAIFEHVHGNSLFLDKDGNLIVSFPGTFEIVKIDMVTGKLIWRLGGDNNEFEITGENETDKPYYFKLQHDAKRLDNGNLLFYDNGVQKTSGWNSRAVEYSLDEENKKAGLVWEYKHDPPVSAYAMGSAQRLKNGNTLIDWGLIFLGLNKGMTEVTPNKEITFELTFPNQNFSYRANKYDLPVCRPVADVDRFEMLNGNTYLFNKENSKTDVEIYFEELDAFTYNAMNVKKFDCAPLNPEFETEAPVLLQTRYFIESMLVYSFKGEIRFGTENLPPHQSVNNLKVFYREKQDSGVFKELPTAYNETEKQIVANSTHFGEFVIGFVRSADEIFPPKLMYPANGTAFVNNNPVQTVWSSTGRYDGFQLQIAEDTIFTNIIFDSTDIKIPIITKKDLSSDKKYFWRAKTFYRDLSSEWSEIGSFNFSNEYLSVIYPNGGETLKKDSTYIIKWNTNLSDSVKVTLLKDGEKILDINSGIYSYSNSIAWKIPVTVANGTGYSVLVTDMKNNNLKAESQNTFTINTTVGVEENFTAVSSHQIEIFPNPGSDNTNIQFTLSESSDIKISITDALGVEQKVILDSFLNDGTYKINLNTNSFLPGIYYCIFRDIKSTEIQKMMIIR